MSVTKFLLLGALALSLSACNPPPSVQKAIDEAKAQEQANAPRLVNPALNAAQEEGRELYRAYLVGKWAPQDSCNSASLSWEFKDKTISRPSDLSSSEKPCKLAVTEALQDGSIAVAAYCPRLEADDEAVVYAITRRSQNAIIIPGIGGGALERCP